MSLVKAARRRSPRETRHAKHNSESLTPRLRYDQDIQSLNDTLSSLSSKYRTKDQSPTASRPQVEAAVDPMHQRLLGRMSVDSSLRVEVELIHSNPYAEVSQSLRSSAATAVVLPSLNPAQSPYAKHTPSSVYSGHKNLTSFDNLTTRQELTATISRVCSLLFPKEPSKTQRLETELLQAYAKSQQLDSWLSNVIWSECLQTLASVGMPHKPSHSGKAIDSDLASVQQDLESLISDYIDHPPALTDDIMASVATLSRLFRILIKKLPSESMVGVGELFWKTAMLLYDELLAVCKREIARSYEDVKTQAKREEGRISAHLRLITEQWQFKLDEVLKENERLKDHERRLKQEMEHCMEMVSERDEELKQLRDSGAFSELEKMLAEFVANAGDDPGDPMMPKSLYGSRPVNGVKLTPTRFGPGKPEPELVIEKVKEPIPEVVLKPPTPPPPPVIETESEESVEVPPLPPSRPVDCTDQTAAPQTHLVSNVILKQILRYPQPSHIFRAKDIYKFFESMMDAKFQLDLFEESKGNSIRSLPDFTLDYLYQKHGKRSDTLKHMASLLKSLEKLRSDGDKYADLLYCMLGLSEVGDFPADLSQFLVKARMAFQEILLRGKGKAAKTDKEVGGKLTFAETADLLYSLFCEKREVGEEVLARIDLQETDEVEKAKLVFSGRLGKIGRDLKYFFVQADLQKTGSVPFPVFERTCRTSLEMNLSQASVRHLWSALTTSDLLTYHQLTALDFKSLSAKAYSKPLAISKLSFMLCIIAQYLSMREKDDARLRTIFQEFDANGDGVLSLGEFEELISSLDADCPLSLSVQMFREALETSDGPNPDFISPDAFCRVALQHRLGGYGKNVFQSSLKHYFSKPQTPKLKPKKKQ